MKLNSLIILSTLLATYILPSSAFPELSINPELNTVLRGNEGKIREALKTELKQNLNDSFKQFDDCTRFPTNLTKFIDGVLVTFYHIEICGLSNKDLIDFETFLEYGVAQFKYSFEEIYLLSDIIVEKPNSIRVDTFDGFKVVMNNVEVDGATGLSIIDNEWRSSNWIQDINPTGIELRGVDNPRLSFNVTKQVFDANSIGRYLRFESYDLIFRELEKQINLALKAVPIDEVLTSNDTLLGMYRSQLASLNKFANNFMDNLLVETRSYLKNNNQEIASIPNYETQFSRTWGPLKFWGTFKCQDGTLRDLSTVRRTANFSLLPMRNTKHVKLFGSVGFDELKFGYNTYEAKMWNSIGPKGSVRADTGDNSIAFYIKGKFDPKERSIKLRYFTVNIVKFENVKIKATGLGPFNWLYSTVLTHMAEDAKDDILPTIEERIEDAVEQSIKEGLVLGGVEKFI